MGVFVVCLFNLRFGWVLSGLVVPGYIVPLLIAKPVSAAVVVVEASLTYALFWLLSEKVSGPTRWSSFFGRDRFMGLILVSVAVRLLLDGWLLPIAAAELDQRYGLALDWRNNLHSFGLIVVALLANQLWKPGFARGMAQVLLMIGATFLIVRYGLMELTNFRIGAVVYLYEDFATSILASPKAYIILISTCFIASRMNLRYGWDFSGILIPALLALQWYQPLKIVTSFVEALIIYFLASALLSSRLFASATIEGGRKILLFFNISFAYKLVLGHVLAFAGVEQRITDYYGFGYLLPTLIALKAHDKDILARVTRATAQISLMGALIGSLAGFVLALVFPDRSGMASAAASLGAGEREHEGRLVARAVGAAAIDAAEGRAATVARGDEADFRSALLLIDQGRSTVEARAQLTASGFLLRPLADGRLGIVPGSGQGFALIFNPGSSARTAILVPEPEAVPGLALAGLSLFQQQKARWLVVGGTRGGTADHPGLAPARLFADSVSVPMLEVRHSDGPPMLRLAGRGASMLDLADLRRALPDLRPMLGETDEPVSTLAVPGGAIPALLARPGEGMVLLPARPLTNPELAFIRTDVIGPLLSGSPAAVSQATLAGAVVGIEVTEVRRPSKGPTFALRRAGGTGQLFVLRPRASGPLIQVASGEGLAPTAARLFAGLSGSALMIVPDQRSLESEEDQLLPLLTEALLHQAPGRQLILELRRPPFLLQAQGPMLAVDRIEPTGGLSDQLLAALARIGIAARPVTFDRADAGLEIAPSAHLRYAQQAHDARGAILWIAPPR